MMFFGVDYKGSKVLGNVTVDRKCGNRVVFNENSEKIYVDIEWIGYGRLKAIDSIGNEYILEVNKD